jgi:acyl-CoA thioester hydrolase
MAAQCFPVTVYLEDTDAQGIVYHANYLKYCERARSHLVHTLGFSFEQLRSEGVSLVVFEMRLKFNKPARMHDNLEIRTRAYNGSDYRLTFIQEVYRSDDDSKPIFAADVTVVAIDHDGRITPIPEKLDASAFGDN